MPFPVNRPQVAVAAGIRASERRAASRHLTIFRIARVYLDDADDLCLIRNISDRGMTIETGLPMKAGDKVRVEIRSDRCIAGTIRWTHDGGAGIQFDAPIDVVEALGGNIPPDAAEHPRAPRFERTGAAVIDAASTSVVAPIANISLSGLCVLADARFRKFERAIVRIDNLCDTAAQVRWVEKGSVGLQFDRPLSFRRFQKWLLDADERKAPDGAAS